MRSAELTRTCMVRIFTLVFLFVPILIVNAQQIAVSSPVYNEFNNVPVSPVLRKNSALETNFRPLKSTFRIPGEKQKKIGSTMMALGGAMLIGGIIMYSRADKTVEEDTVWNTNGTYDIYYNVDAKYPGGILLMIAGTGISVPGVLIWRKGVKKYNQYMIEQERLSFFYHGTGATIQYRF
jgi:hypothetical protein